MATPVTYNGTQYNVPAYQDTGYAQGAGNLSSYLIALATGSLTLAGGTFTLTADVDFGANFGLKSIYYKSRAANPSTAGVLRLGNNEAIGWRNALNSANFTLELNASNVLATTAPLSATAATLTNTTNQVVLGTTNTTTISSTAPGSSRTYTIPDAGGDVQFVMAGGTQTIAGAKTFSTAVTINPTTNQIVLGVTNTTTINSTAPAASRTYTIPDAGGAASFILSAGAQTITGAKTFADQTLLLQETGSTDVITINVAALAASRAYTLPDAGGAASFVMTAGAQTIGGAKTFSSVITAPNGTSTAPGYTFGTATYGIAFESGLNSLTFCIPANANYYWKANDVVYLRMDTGSPPSLIPEGITTKTMDIGSATLAFDDMYADDFQNVADIPFFDFRKDLKTGKEVDVDDLTVIRNIRAKRDKEGNLMFDENGYAYWDDDTLPEFIFTTDKRKDRKELVRDADGKPYVSLKVLCGLALGGIKQLAEKVASLEKQ